MCALAASRSKPPCRLRPSWPGRRVWSRANRRTSKLRSGMLIVLGGLPGVGKTTIARELARRLGAVHLRIDTIEQAILNAQGTREDIGEEGYCVAYAVAEDNLRLGRVVIADSVNPIQITRDAWLSVASRANVPVLEVEIQCSDR